MVLDILAYCHTRFFIKGKFSFFIFQVTSNDFPFNRIPSDAIKRGKTENNDPLNIDPELVKLGIHSMYLRRLSENVLSFHTQTGHSMVGSLFISCL